MDAVTVWLRENWWWLHMLLLGLLAGRSLGMWAYRDVWYAASTFLSGPADTRGFVRMLRQWLAAMILAIPALSTVALIAALPQLFQRLEERGARIGAITIAIAAWGVVSFVATLWNARVQGSPSPFPNPFRWARFRANESPDTIVFTWVDAVLGLLLHIGIAVGWVVVGDAVVRGAWEPIARYGASAVLVLVATTISVLVHPRPVSHEAE